MLNTKKIWSSHGEVALTFLAVLFVHEVTELRVFDFFLDLKIRLNRKNNAIPKEISAQAIWISNGSITTKKKICA
jgi:hypothetical protein